MKFAAYVSGNATTLKRFFEAYKNDDVINQFVFVIIDNINNHDLRALCDSINIPLIEHSYKQLELSGKDRNKFISQQILENMVRFKVDYCFIFGARVLYGDLLKKYRYRLINFHPSVLPSFKGTKAIDQALEAKSFLLGNTAHFVTADLDGGPVIMQSILPAARFHDYDSVLNMQPPMMYQIIKWLCDNRISVHDGNVFIKDAVYNAGTFIPEIE